MFIDSTHSVIQTSPVVNKKLLQSVKMDFGTWLKEQRDKASLTQGELSERTDKTVSVSMISSIESGARKASLVTVNRLARALGANKEEARVAAGFAPEHPLEREKPQTVQELLDRLNELGVENPIFKGGIENLPDDPDVLEDILRVISMTVEIELRKSSHNHATQTERGRLHI